MELNKIPHNRPFLMENDIISVENVLRSGWIAHGPQVAGLESDFEKFLNGGKSCACSSGTAALFLALRALGMGRGSRVALPTYACSALLNAVHMVGAEPVVFDVRPDNFNIDAARMPKGLDAAILVHVYGVPADIEAIAERVPIVIQDCCHSIGGLLSGRPLGAQGHAAVFSFFATKIITCGYGGLVWFADKNVADKAHDYREFDCRKDYEPRFNFHLSDINAALVRSQFSRLSAIRERRLSIARSYAECLPESVSLQAGTLEKSSMVYRFVMIFGTKEARDRAQSFLNARGVEAIIPIEAWELIHNYLGLDPRAFPNAEFIAARTLSLPLYPALTDQQVQFICELLTELEV